MVRVLLITAWLYLTLQQTENADVLHTLKQKNFLFQTYFELKITKLLVISAILVLLSRARFDISRLFAKTVFFHVRGAKGHIFRIYVVY